MTYFDTFVKEFKTSQSIKDAYGEKAPLIGPVGMTHDKTLTYYFSEQRLSEGKKEQESIIAMMESLDYPKRQHLVGIIQGVLDSCEESVLTCKINDILGPYKVIRGVTMFKVMIKWGE